MITYDISKNLSREISSMSSESMLHAASMQEGLSHSTMPEAHFTTPVIRTPGVTRVWHGIRWEVTLVFHQQYVYELPPFEYA